VEFGANIPTPSDYKIDIQTDICNLVFIGKNWQKKGGDKVLGAYRKLKSDGFRCTLTIIGSIIREPFFCQFFPIKTKLQISVCISIL